MIVYVNSVSGKGHAVVDGVALCGAGLAESVETEGAAVTCQRCSRKAGGAPAPSKRTRKTTRKTKSAPRHECGTCGKQGRAEDMIFSRHTGARYCKDLGACMKRRRRKPRR